MPEDKSAFDINHPSRVGADPNSKPVIVGHHPITHDPMVNQHVQSEPKKIEIKDEVDEPHFLNTPIPVLKTDNQPKIPKSRVDTMLEDKPLTTSHELASVPDSKPESNPRKLPFISLSALTSSKDDLSPKHQSVSHQPDNIQVSNDTIVETKDNIIKPPKKKFAKRLMPMPLSILVLFAGLYLALDAKIIPNSINLPVKILNKSDDSSSSTSTSLTAASLPLGFTKYNLAGTNVYFAASGDWGVPTVATDDGYTKRGGNNAANGKYAYMVTFPNNKDIQVVFVSSKYLPAARTAVYYDFLQWCVGTNDGNYYQSALRYTTKDGVDTPATISCDQGPLQGVTKLDDTTLIQKNAKTADGKDFGDLYIKNLTDKNIPVVRVRDISMKNGGQITNLLNNISFSSSSQ